MYHELNADFFTSKLDRNVVKGRPLLRCKGNEGESGGDRNGYDKGSIKVGKSIRVTNDYHEMPTPLAGMPTGS